MAIALFSVSRRRLARPLAGCIRRVAARFAALARDTHGGVAIYAVLAGGLTLGTMVLGVDVGRMIVVRSQMQNAADAAAMAAATQLDGLDGAQRRASAIASNAALNASSLTIEGGELSVASVEFFSAYADGVGTPSEGDEDANFVRVNLAPQEMYLFFGPLLGGGASETQTLAASATASSSPIVCNAPPFMMCPIEDDVSAMLDEANVGRQVRLKDVGGGAFRPGNFGLLCAGGDCGANAIGDALAGLGDGSCTGTTVETATGVKTNQVADGINARFDTGSRSPKNPARNVINYARDSDMSDSTLIGNGSWNPSAYWTAKHPSDTPPDGMAGYSRYQMYLYELGETFGRKGKVTLYPVKDAEAAESGGWSVVEPGHGEDELVPVSLTEPTDNDFDGVPQSTSEVVDDPLRRVVVAAVLACEAQNVRGHGEYTAGGYVFLFLTETVDKPPNAVVYAELVGAFNQETSPDYHVNARLVE